MLNKTQKEQDDTRMLTSFEVKNIFSTIDWQMKVYSEFDSLLSSKQRPFPCIYGVNGHIKGQLRFNFFETITAQSVADSLKEYLPNSKKYGFLTSLVIFEKPSKIQTIEKYYEQFWTLLDDVVSLDSQPWPSSIPQEIDHEKWEFCFENEPIFVVCNTPSHVYRQSRRSSGFMLTFQPRWVFNDILGTTKKSEQAFLLVKKRIDNYDLIEKSSLLGKYGDDCVREYQQYFLADENKKLTCPYKKLGEKNAQ